MTKIKRCKTCKYWTISKPEDQMKIERELERTGYNKDKNRLQWRKCILFEKKEDLCQADNWWNSISTSEKFGCIFHEDKISILIIKKSQKEIKL